MEVMPVSGSIVAMQIFNPLYCSLVIFLLPEFCFYPTALRAVGVLFSPMVSGWAGGRREEVCPACISEAVRCRKLILGRDIG